MVESIQMSEKVLNIIMEAMGNLRVDLAQRGQTKVKIIIERKSLQVDY